MCAARPGKHHLEQSNSPAGEGNLNYDSKSVNARLLMLIVLVVTKEL